MSSRLHRALVRLTLVLCILTYAFASAWGPWAASRNPYHRMWPVPTILRTVAIWSGSLAAVAVVASPVRTNLPGVALVAIIAGITGAAIIQVALFPGVPLFRDRAPPILPHPRLGLVYRPSASTIEYGDGFRVRFTVDAYGCRVTPRATTTRATVGGFGCSFFAGVGVEDHETWAWRLAELLPDVQVTNYAIGGGGQAQEYLRIKDLAERGTLPDLLLVSVAAFHIERNYRGAAGQFGFPLPHLEPVGPDGLVESGVYQVGPAGPPAADLYRAQVEVTRRALHGANALARARGSRLVAVLMECGSSPAERFVVDHIIAGASVDAIDLRDLPTYDMRLPEHHPTADWHRAMADALAPEVRRRLPLR